MKKQTDHHQNHIFKWKQSGLSMRKYCSEQGISYWSFRDWKKKIELENSVTGNGLIEIPAGIYRKPEGNEPLEIILTNGIKIIVNENSGT